MRRGWEGSVATSTRVAAVAPVTAGARGRGACTHTGAAQPTEVAFRTTSTLPVLPPTPRANSRSRPTTVPLGSRRRRCHRRRRRHGRGASRVAVDRGPAPPVARCGSQWRGSAPLATSARIPPAPSVGRVRDSAACFGGAKGAQKTRFQHGIWQRRGAAVLAANQRAAHSARRGLGWMGWGWKAACCLRACRHRC